MCRAYEQTIHVLKKMCIFLAVMTIIREIQMDYSMKRFYEALENHLEEEV